MVNKRRKAQLDKNAQKERPSEAEFFARRYLFRSGKIESTTDDVGFLAHLQGLGRNKGKNNRKRDMERDVRGQHEIRWQERLERELGITS